MSGNPQLAALIESGTVGEAGAALESKALGGMGGMGGMDLSQLLSGVGQLQGGQQQQSALPAPALRQGQNMDMMSPLIALLALAQPQQRNRRTSLL
jgi:hypothetical protein